MTVRKTRKRNPHRGSSFDSFLKDEDLLEETHAHAIKAVLAWQLAEEMKAQKISQKRMAERLRTSRTQVARLLDPDNDSVTLATLKRAARLVGKRIRLELVDPA
jgi:predicted XRE-type DNA-binding protein